MDPLKNSTFEIFPSSSLALAVSVTVAGAVKLVFEEETDTVGAMGVDVAGAGADTSASFIVTPTACEVVLSPLLSVAFAVIE